MGTPTGGGQPYAAELPVGVFTNGIAVGAAMWVVVVAVVVLSRGRLSRPT